MRNNVHCINCERKSCRLLPALRGRYCSILQGVYETAEKFLVIKPTRCTNFSNLFLEYNSTCFGQFLCPSSGFLHRKHNNGICHTGLLTACEQDQAVSKPVWHIPLLCLRWRNPDDGQRNCPKYVELYSKIKLE